MVTDNKVPSISSAEGQLLSELLSKPMSKDLKDTEEGSDKSRSTITQMYKLHSQTRSCL
jgi:hypothetical protein